MYVCVLGLKLRDGFFDETRKDFISHTLMVESSDERKKTGGIDRVDCGSAYCVSMCSLDPQRKSGWIYLRRERLKTGGESTHSHLRLAEIATFSLAGRNCYPRVGVPGRTLVSIL